MIFFWKAAQGAVSKTETHTSGLQPRLHAARSRSKQTLLTGLFETIITVVWGQATHGSIFKDQVGEM